MKTLTFCLISLLFALNLISAKEINPPIKVYTASFITTFNNETGKTTSEWKLKQYGYTDGVAIQFVNENTLTLALECVQRQRCEEWARVMYGIPDEYRICSFKTNEEATAYKEQLESGQIESITLCYSDKPSCNENLKFINWIYEDSNKCYRVLKRNEQQSQTPTQIQQPSADVNVEKK